MGVPYYGDFAEDDTVDIPFNTFTSDDPSASSTITNFINTDVHIHKDGGLTQRNNAAGITVSVNFDGITGNHLVKIDTSDDTVASFWVTGSEYQVRIEGTTVDGATINAWIGTFSIERAGGVIALLKLIQAAVITNAAGVDIAADIIALKAETATILVDTGTTLDTLIKDIPTVAEFEARTLVAADYVVVGDTIAGVTSCGTVTGNVNGNVGGNVTGSVGSLVGHTVQTGDSFAIVNGAAGLVAINTDVEAILTDTGTTLPATLSTIAGYLDTEIAAIKAVTDDMKHKDTTIATVTTADTVFTLTDGLTANDDVNNAVCSIYDTTGSVWSGPRRITDYVHASKTVTIDANTPFALQAADRVVIWNTSYATTAAAGSVSASDIADIADAVWDEAQSDHITEGSTGEKQNRSDRVGR